MRTRSRQSVLRWVLVVAGVLLTTGSGWCGRDMDFVTGLMDRGYHDLALEELERISNDASLPKADREVLDLVKGQIHVSLARQTADPSERSKLLQEASRSFKAFEQANPNHPRLVEVSLEQGRLMSERAGAAADRYRVEADEAKKKTLLAEAEGLYTEAIAHTNKVAEKLNERLTQLRAERPRTKAIQAKMLETVLTRIKALVQVGDMEYLYATLYPPKSAERAKHLDGAVKAYEIVAGEVPTTNFTFLAYARRGMCLGELALMETDSKKRDRMLQRAMESFDAALKCKREDATYAIRLEALRRKAELSFETRQYEDAIGTSDAYLREAGQGIGTYEAQELVLLRARSQAAHAFALKNQKDEEWQGFYEEAVKTLQMVRPQFAELRSEADKLMQTWATQAGGVTIDIPESVFVLVNRARKLMQERRRDEAIEAYQQVVDKVSTAEDRKYAAEAWSSIGTLYFQKKAYYETALAWGKLVEEYRDITPRASGVSYYVSQLYSALYNHEKDDFDLDRYLESLESFISAFPKDKRFFEATAKLAEVLELKGEYSRAAAMWGKADVENPRYAEAMMKSGQLYWRDYSALAEKKQGESAQARQALMKAEEQLRLCGQATVTAEDQVQWPARGLFELVEILTDRSLPQPKYASKAPAVLDDLEKRFAESEPARRLLLRVRALCLMKKPVEAERYGEELAREYVATAQFQEACRELLVAFQDAGNRAKSTEWQKRMVLNIDNATPEQLEQLGQSFWAQKDYDQAIRYLSKLEGKLRKADPQRKLPEVQRNLAAVYFEGARYDSALPYYEKFYADSPDDMLLLTRLARCQEEAGDARDGYKSWTKVQDKLLAADPEPLFFEARLHMVRCLKKLKSYREGVQLIKQTRALYGSFGKDADVNEEVKKLLKEMGG